jgi:hypothetical protein
MSLAVAFLIIVGLALLLYAFLMFDRIVRTEYEKNRIVWEADGRPCGFFWNAPECTLVRSGWARNRLSFVWLFTTPSWSDDSAECKIWLRRLRVSVFAWNVLILVSFLVFASR